MTAPAEPIQIRLVRLDFLQNVTRDAANQPLIGADVVAEQGARVVIVDLRAREELLQPLGFIAGSVHVPLARIMEVRTLGAGARVVLVSRHGRRAAVAARLLELSGMPHVAALDGGLEAWRSLGLPTCRRDERIVDVLPGDPDAVLLQPERPRTLLTLDELRAHVSDADRIRWVKLAAFLLHGKTACVDGRDSQGVVGTPGGDVGELLLALGAVEALGIAIEPADVPKLIEGWIDAFGRIYLHSDIHALNAHIAAMRADPQIPESALPSREAPPSAWRAFHSAPPVELRPRVLQHLLAHMGCGHLRLLLEHSEAYGVRRELARAVVAGVMDARWDGVPEVDFVVLGGGHQEGAVLLVEIDGALHPHTRVPLVPPAYAGLQMFVHHPQVTAYQRVEACHWLATHPAFPALRGRDAELLDAMRGLAARQMQTTLGHLARGLPIFRAVYGADRSVHVEQVGTVPG